MPFSGKGFEHKLVEEVSPSLREETFEKQKVQGLLEEEKTFGENPLEGHCSLSPSQTPGARCPCGEGSVGRDSRWSMLTATAFHETVSFSHNII